MKAHRPYIREERHEKAKELYSARALESYTLPCSFLDERCMLSPFRFEGPGRGPCLCPFSLIMESAQFPLGLVLTLSHVPMLLFSTPALCTLFFLLFSFAFTIPNLSCALHTCRSFSAIIAHHQTLVFLFPLRRSHHCTRTHAPLCVSDTPTLARCHLPFLSSCVVHTRLSFPLSPRLRHVPLTHSIVVIQQEHTTSKQFYIYLCNKVAIFYYEGYAKSHSFSFNGYHGCPRPGSRPKVRGAGLKRA